MFSGLSFRSSVLASKRKTVIDQVLVTWMLSMQIPFFVIVSSVLKYQQTMYLAVGILTKIA